MKLYSAKMVILLTGIMFLLFKLSELKDIPLLGYKYRRFLNVETVNSAVFELRSDSKAHIGFFDDQKVVLEYGITAEFISIRGCSKDLSCPKTVRYVNSTINNEQPTVFWVKWYGVQTEIGLGKIAGLQILASELNLPSGNVKYMGFSGPGTNATLSSFLGYRCKHGFKIEPILSDNLVYANSIMDCSAHCQMKRFCFAVSYSSTSRRCYHIARATGPKNVSTPFNIGLSTDLQKETLKRRVCIKCESNCSAKYNKFQFCQMLNLRPQDYNVKVIGLINYKLLLPVD